MAELYAGESIGALVLVTGVLGGGAAWFSGRAIAGAWQPPWHVAVVALLLAAATRFIHFALFHGELFSAPSYACDTLFLFIVGLLAWRATRASQMVRQYPWLYVRAGPLQWRAIGREETPPQ
jgi:uncharacterized protein DUF6867